MDGIAISVNEPKSVESVMKRAQQSGIKVLTFDSDSPKSGRSMYIGTNNESAGATMAETMGRALNGNGEVAIITGQLGAVNLNERIAGIKKGLAKYPGIKIVETQGTEDDLAKGVSVTETTLRAHPQLKGIFGVSQVGGPAVSKVLNTKEFGAMKGKLEVLAFDDLPTRSRRSRTVPFKGSWSSVPSPWARLLSITWSRRSRERARRPKISIQA